MDRFKPVFLLSFRPYELTIVPLPLFCYGRRLLCKQPLGTMVQAGIKPLDLLDLDVTIDATVVC
jgi:hypothetical protein